MIGGFKQMAKHVYGGSKEIIPFITHASFANKALHLKSIQAHYNKFNSTYTPISRNASQFNKTNSESNAVILQNKRPPISFTFTSHPTNIGFNYKNSDGSRRRPFLWEEIEHYSEKIASFAQRITYNPSIKDFNTWIGFDMDRHQDERKNIFTYATLHNKKIALRANGVPEESDIIRKISDITSKLKNSFDQNKTIDVTSELAEIQNMINEAQIENTNPYFPLESIAGQYRISSEDLFDAQWNENSKGIAKIKERIDELKSLTTIFGKCPVSELIIADCTDEKHVEKVKELLHSASLYNISVTPLIEEDLGAEKMREIVKSATNKVMLAGSDSIQRETYCGTLMMKLNLQKIIAEENEKRIAEGREQITFFEGAGSTINRNGCIPSSRSGTIMNTMNYERTIQGQELESFLTDPEYAQSIINSFTNSTGCTLKDVDMAQETIRQVFDEVSQYQKAIQQEPQYTNFFDKERIFNLVKENSFCGSRAKAPKNIESFLIKEQRAITQSMIHDEMGFHPEMLYWDRLSEKTKTDIKNNLHNPIIKDFLNHYTATFQACKPHENTWIKDKNISQNLEASHQSLKNFITEIKSTPNCPKDLLLNDLDNHGPRFSLPHLPSSKLPSMNYQSLRKNIGFGFSTYNKQNDQVKSASSIKPKEYNVDALIR